MKNSSRFLLWLNLAATSLCFFVLFFLDNSWRPERIAKSAFLGVYLTVVINAMYITPFVFFIGLWVDVVRSGKPLRHLLKALVPTILGMIVAAILVVFLLAKVGDSATTVPYVWLLSPLACMLTVVGVAAFVIKALWSRRRVGVEAVGLQEAAGKAGNWRRSAEKSLRVLLIAVTFLFPVLVLVEALSPGIVSRRWAPPKRGNPFTESRFFRKHGKKNELVGKLENADPSINVPALREIQGMSLERKREFLPWLLADLRDPDPEVQRRAAAALGSFDAIAFEDLSEILRTGGDRTRKYAVIAFAYLKTQSEKTAPILASLLRDPKVPGDIKEDIIDLVPRMLAGPDLKMTVLSNGLDQTGGRTSMMALNAMESFGPSAVPYFVKALKWEMDEDVRVGIVQFLGERGKGNDETVPALRKTLAWSDAYFPEETISALQKLGTPEAMKVLSDYQGGHK